MTSIARPSRRRVLQSLSLTLPLLPLATATVKSAFAADSPSLLSTAAPEAKAVKYVEDATQAQGAIPGSTCANCGLYQGKAGAAMGPCQIFTGKQVKAAGWCSSWAPQM